jgi:hypothetical protein
MSDVNIGLVLDCADPEALAEFWAPALGYLHLDPHGRPRGQRVLRLRRRPTKLYTVQPGLDSV